MADLKTIKTQRVLKCPLDEHRKAEIADEVAKIHGRVDELADREEQLKGQLKTVRGDMEEREGKARELSRVVRSGFEERAVDCEMREHPDRPVWVVVRLDTGETIEEKPFSQADAQRELIAREKEQATDGEQAAPANGSTETAETKQEKKPGAVACPFVLEVLDEADPRQDKLCGADGATRNRGFCAEHKEALGGKDGLHKPEALRHIARRTQRVQLWREEQEKQAEEDILPTTPDDGGLPKAAEALN